jgi:hypothetical protein
MSEFEIIILLRKGNLKDQLLTENKVLAYEWLKERAAEVLEWEKCIIEETYETITASEEDVYSRINRDIRGLGYEFIWLTEVEPQ